LTSKVSAGDWRATPTIVWAARWKTEVEPATAIAVSGTRRVKLRSPPP